MKECPMCGAEADDDAEACPDCGASFDIEDAWLKKEKEEDDSEEE